jgi:glucose-fructose oxidoreductase
MKNRHNSRRDFIKTVGTGALAASLPFHIPSFAKEKLGVALVGLGYYSTDVLVPAFKLTKNCYFAGIVTGSPEKAKKWQAAHNIPDKNVYNYENFDKIANNPDIDVVYVVLPPSMHKEYVVRAANAGKHVWCEKPMAVTVAECETMIKACQQNKVTLAIGYRLQHEPNTQKVMQLVRNQTFGKTRLVSCAAGYFDGRTTHWKQKKAMGGGSMYDMGVYSLQGARYAVGQEPKAVFAQQFTNRPEVYTEVDETMMYQLEFPNGAIANCTTSFGMNMNYLNATCEKGWFKLEPFQGYNGVTGNSSAGLLNASIDNQQARQMDDDASAIMNKKPLIAPGEEGLRDIRVVEAIYESVKQGKRIII